MYYDFTYGFRGGVFCEGLKLLLDSPPGGCTPGLLIFLDSHSWLSCNGDISLLLPLTVSFFVIRRMERFFFFPQAWRSFLGVNYVTQSGFSYYFSCETCSVGTG